MSNFNKILSLSDQLRKKGLFSLANEIEHKFLILKKSKNDLYKAIKETGDDLIQVSHPSGSISVQESSDDLGVVETILDQNKKIIDIVNKNPSGKLASKDILFFIKNAEADREDLANVLLYAGINPKKLSTFQEGICELYIQAIENPKFNDNQRQLLKSFIDGPGATEGRMSSKLDKFTRDSSKPGYSKAFKKALDSYRRVRGSTLEYSNAQKYPDLQEFSKFFERIGTITGREASALELAQDQVTRNPARFGIDPSKKDIASQHKMFDTIEKRSKEILRLNDQDLESLKIQSKIGMADLIPGGRMRNTKEGIEIMYNLLNDLRPGPNYDLMSDQEIIREFDKIKIIDPSKEILLQGKEAIDNLVQQSRQAKKIPDKISKLRAATLECFVMIDNANGVVTDQLTKDLVANMPESQLENYYLEARRKFDAYFKEHITTPTTEFEDAFNQTKKIIEERKIAIEEKFPTAPEAQSRLKFEYRIDPTKISEEMIRVSAGAASVDEAVIGSFRQYIRKTNTGRMFAHGSILLLVGLGFATAYTWTNEAFTTAEHFIGCLEDLLSNLKSGNTFESDENSEQTGIFGYDVKLTEDYRKKVFEVLRKMISDINDLKLNLGKDPYGGARNAFQQILDELSSMEKKNFTSQEAEDFYRTHISTLDPYIKFYKALTPKYMNKTVIDPYPFFKDLKQRIIEENGSWAQPGWTDFMFAQFSDVKEALANIDAILSAFTKMDEKDMVADIQDMATFVKMKAKSIEADKVKVLAKATESDTSGARLGETVATGALGVVVLVDPSSPSPSASAAPSATSPAPAASAVPPPSPVPLTQPEATGRDDDDQFSPGDLQQPARPIRRSDYKNPADSTPTPGGL